MTSALCNLTGSKGTLVKSHLYPRSFYKIEQDQPMSLISSESRPKRAINGIYDPGLVTSEGEQILEKFDNFAAKFFEPFGSRESMIKRADKVIEDSEKQAGVQFDQSHAESVLLFLISLLWRFGASSRPEASGVGLGPYLERFKEAILENTVRKIPYVGAAIQRDFSNSPVVITPALQADKSLKVYNMVCGGYSFWVKCDKRPFEREIQEVAVFADRPVTIGFHQISETANYRSLARLVRKSNKIHGSPWGGKYVTKAG